MDAGYSETPLTRKLGLKVGQRVLLLNAPVGYAHSVLPEGVTLLKRAAAPLDFVQLFVTQRDVLGAELRRLLPLLAPAGMLWVSWPKQSAMRRHGIATDLTEDVVREHALPLGLVDVKVCAVDELWSGLKLVIRRELR